MSNKLKPLIDATYPAVMAGLCLASLGIYHETLTTALLELFLSAASLLFIVSSVSVFAHSVIVDWDTEKDDESSEITPLWIIGKFSFLLGIIILLISIMFIFIIKCSLFVNCLQNSNSTYF